MFNSKYKLTDQNSIYDIWMHFNFGEKTVTSNTSISNLKNFNLENESGELKVSRELEDGMTQYQLGNWKMDWLDTG